MLNRKLIGALALAGAFAWGCTPDDYPTEARFEPPPEEIELPDGELFFYVPPSGVNVSSVTLRGTFNNWGPPNGEDIVMEELSDGRWVAGVDLEPGEYMYKYFFNGTDWATSMCNDPTYGDPANGGKVDAEVEECTGGGDGIRVVASPGHTFLYIPREDHDVEVVTVAGSFQDPQWTNTTDTLDNIWTLTVDMEPGTYEYKYVFNDGDWAENMCEEPQWGDSTNTTDPRAVDPDNPVCVAGGNGTITITEAGPHTFRYIVPASVVAAGDSISTIHIAGSFQDPQWVNNSPATEMVETFQRTYNLPASETPYEYKFIFDGNWANNMCTDTETWGNPTTGLVDANNTDGCHEGGNAFLIVE